MDQQTRAAIKRLNSDWQEIQRDPVACVSAMPLEKDIFEVWHSEKLKRHPNTNCGP